MPGYVMVRGIEYERRPVIIALFPRQAPFFEETFELRPSSERREQGTDNRDTTGIYPSYETREKLRALFLNDAFICNENAFEVRVCDVLECFSRIESLNNANLGAKCRDKVLVCSDEQVRVAQRKQKNEWICCCGFVFCGRPARLFMNCPMSRLSI